MRKFIPNKIIFKGYKCFVEECTIPWFSSFNVIIGRNNSGKSSFLDIIHSLCDACFRADISKTINKKISYYVDYSHPLNEEELDVSYFQCKNGQVIKAIILLPIT